MTKTNNSKGNIDISVVMPCLNEEESIEFCIKKALLGIKKTGLTGEVLISDNGSTDNSVRIAIAAGARVVHQQKKGYGNAYIKGISEAKGKYIVMGDSDKTYDFADIKKLIDPLRTGKYDLVMGTRLKGKIMPGAMPWLHQYIGNPFLSWFLNLLFHTGMSDAHCGMRALTKEAFERMHLRTPGMEFASEMVINAAKAKLRMKEVPITLYANPDRKPHLRSFRDGWRHLKFMFMYSPFHLFFLPGIMLFLLGIIILAGLSLSAGKMLGLNLGPISGVLGSILILLGFQIMFLGFFSKIMYSKVSPFKKDLELRGILKSFDSFFTLERSLLFGIGLLIVGVILNMMILLKWISLHFGPLGLMDAVNSVIGLTLIFLAIQVVFCSFFVSMIKSY